MNSKKMNMSPKERAAFRKGCIYMERKLREKSYKAFDEGIEAENILLSKKLSSEEMQERFAQLMDKHKYKERH